MEPPSLKHALLHHLLLQDHGFRLNAQSEFVIIAEMISGLLHFCAFGGLLVYSERSFPVFA